MTAEKLEYVTVDDVKFQLGIPITDTYHDERIELEIQAASGMVKNYLGSKSVYQTPRDDDDDFEVDSNFEPIIESFTGEPITMVRPEVKKAVLLVVHYWWNGSEIEEVSMLPMSVRAILYPLRDPQLK